LRCVRGSRSRVCNSRDYFMVVGAMHRAHVTLDLWSGHLVAGRLISAWFVGSVGTRRVRRALMSRVATASVRAAGFTARGDWSVRWFKHTSRCAAFESRCCRCVHLRWYVREPETPVLSEKAGSAQASVVRRRAGNTRVLGADKIENARALEIRRRAGNTRVLGADKAENTHALRIQKRARNIRALGADFVRRP